MSMSAPRLLLRAARPAALPKPAPPLVSRPSPRRYAAQRLDVQRLRADVDKTARKGFYQLSKMQGALAKIEPRTAEAIVQDFVAHKTTKDHASNIRYLAKKYNLPMDELTTIAIVTYRIPDLSDAAKRAVLPQSQHKPIAAQMLQGCVELADPLAVIHVMTAVYLSAIPTETAAREIASLIPRSKLPAYRKTLESLADKLNADALTLQGLFAQREGSVQRALDLFESATKNYKLGTRHPMQLPLIAPWNALGLLCETSPDANLRKTARAAFETGARSHDDPLSCAHFATFYDRTDKEWLQYTSKAAASGHRDSSAALALFYRDAAAPDSPLLASAPIQNALRWLTGWKEGSSERLAEEWAHVAADLGHKPSMLLLADWYEARGERESARAMLHKAVEGDARTDEWPQLVPKARARLARLKV